MSFPRILVVGPSRSRPALSCSIERLDSLSYSWPAVFSAEPWPPTLGRLPLTAYDSWPHASGRRLLATGYWPPTDLPLLAACNCLLLAAYYKPATTGPRLTGALKAEVDDIRV